MREGMTMNGSHGAGDAFRDRKARVARILNAVGQTLPAISWLGLVGEFSVVLNFNKSTMTHVRTYASRRGEPSTYANDRYSISLRNIEKACAAALECVPKANYTGSITIEFTHSNALVAHGNTIFGNIVEIKD